MQLVCTETGFADPGRALAVGSTRHAGVRVEVAEFTLRGAVEVDPTLDTGATLGAR